MPYDAITTFNEFASATCRQRREALIYDLEHLPDSWQWNFNACGTCGIGRFNVLMGHIPEDGNMPYLDDEMVELLGLSTEQYFNIFTLRGKVSPTAQDVATRLRMAHEEILNSTPV